MQNDECRMEEKEPFKAGLYLASSFCILVSGLFPGAAVERPPNGFYQYG
jgi:hypothetical protein